MISVAFTKSSLRLTCRIAVELVYGYVNSLTLFLSENTVRSIGAASGDEQKDQELKKFLMLKERNILFDLNF